MDKSCKAFEEFVVSRSEDEGKINAALCRFAMTKNDVLDDICLIPETKVKNTNCADLIQIFISTLNPNQLQTFWDIESVVKDYNIFIQDEIFKRLL